MQLGLHSPVGLNVLSRFVHLVSLLELSNDYFFGFEEQRIFDCFFSSPLYSHSGLAVYFTQQLKIGILNPEVMMNCILQVAVMTGS